jgi:mRNA interferase RelE/StbE
LCFHPPSLSDLFSKRSLRQIEKVAEKPELGEPLGKAGGMDLTGYRKLYFARKGYRVVYRIIEARNVVEVVGIGRRARMEIHEEVRRHLK